MQYILDSGHLRNWQATVMSSLRGQTSQGKLVVTYTK